ncbi:MAG: hypothetical protein R3F30_15845 [Planctomycetota bacterium]
MDPVERQRVLQRVDRRRGMTPLVLVIVGTLCLVSILPMFSAQLEPGTWAGTTRFLLGLSFFYLAALVWERQHQTHLLREVLSVNETLVRHLLGPEYGRRKGVALLISMLGKAADDEARERIRVQLVKLTGQDLPADEAAWRAWLEGQQEPEAGPSPGGPA